MNNKNIGFFIKKRRKQLNITQQHLSSLSDVSTRKISDIETANGTTTIDTLNKVCDVLGLEFVLKIKGVEL